MSTARVNCPSCRRLFEFDEEFRGEAVECPRCGVEFQIPLAGTEGVLLTAEEESSDEATFDIACPYCHTVFEVPEDFRGELAECAECTKVFAIPESGNRGLRLDEAEPAPEAASSAPSPPPAPGPSGTTSMRALKETSSGILIEPSLSGSAGRTATVRLSRREVVANLMKPQALGGGEDDLGAAAGKAGGDSGNAPLAGSLEGNFIPLSGAAGASTGGASSRPPIRFSDMPPWVPRIDLEREESIVEFEPGAETSLVPYYILTGVPVFLIPIAVILGHFIHPAAATSICFLLALGCWGVFAAVKLPTLRRKILILTTERAIMADPHEVVDIDIDAVYDEDED